MKILSCLQAGPRFNAKELAQQLNVSRRTIFRDLNLIRDSGVTVQFDELHEAYRLGTEPLPWVPPRFSEREVLQLVAMCQLSHLQRCASFAAQTQDVLSSLLKRSPLSTQVAASRLQGACQVAGNKLPERATKFLDAIIRGITGRIQLRLRVQPDVLDEERGVGQVDSAPYWTRFSPFRCIAEENQLTVLGRSSLHRRVMSIRLERIEQVEFTEETFAVPRGFRSRPLV